MRFALEHGAERIVLFGWSMGAAIALQIATDREFRGVIDRLILDSPVLDWYTTIASNCSRAGLPPQSGMFARPWLECNALARVVGLRSAIPLGRFDWSAQFKTVPVPTLILHGAHDSSFPPALAQQLAREHPGLVQLELFQGDHTLGWNSDLGRWKRRTRQWLATSEPGT